MRLLHRRRRAVPISYCETCGQVCDERCGRETITERNVVSALRELGPRL